MCDCPHSLSPFFSRPHSKQVSVEVSHFRPEKQLPASGDIRSPTDLCNSFAVVREMHSVPFAKDDMVRLLIPTGAPIVPLLLTIMPPEGVLPVSRTLWCEIVSRVLPIFLPGTGPCAYSLLRFVSDAITMSESFFNGCIQIPPRPTLSAPALQIVA
jgi:hypothetical protein